MNLFYRYRRMVWTLIVVTCLLGLTTTTALAIVVTPSAPDGWAPANVRANATVAITTAQPRSGNGSLEFTTNTITPGQDKADYEKLWDPASFPSRTLAGLTALSYEYYRSSSSTTASHLAPVLRLYVGDANPLSPTFGKYALLIWEPVYNGAAPIPTDQWITQNILNGKFWMFVPSGQSIPSGVVQNYSSTLNDWITGSPVGQPGDPAPINIDQYSIVFGVNVGVGSGWGATFRGFVDNVTLQWGSDEVHANFEVDQCTTVCYVDAVNGNDTNSGQTLTSAKKTIQAAIDAVQPGGQVRVLPGTYNEVATNRFVLGSNGPHQFGLFIAKNGVTIMGVDASDNPITSATAVLATVNTNATNTFGYSGIFVEGDNVTIQGLRIGPNTPGNNKTIEVIGDGFTLRDVHLAVTAPGFGAVYFGDWRYDTVNNISHIQSYLIEENWFDLGGLISINNGTGVGGSVSNRIIQNNLFTMNGSTNPAISLTGSGTTVPWFVHPVGGAIIQGNTFSGSTQYIRSRGTVIASEFDWTSYWYNNTYDKAVVALVGSYPPFDVRSYTSTIGTFIFPNTKRIGAVIQGEVNNAQPTDTVLVKAATYVEQVVITKTLQLVGESGSAVTFIQAPATIPPSSSLDSTIVKIAGSGINVEVTGFTITGPGPGGCGSIRSGVFVGDNANAFIHNNVIRDIRDNPISGCQNGIGILVGSSTTSGTATIQNNTVIGYQKNGITVSGTGSDALIENNIVTGAGAVNFIAQNGVQVSFGATATVKGNTISGHSYTPFTYVSTGVLIYEANADTEGNTISQNQVGIYHIDGSGTHDGNLINATATGTGSPGFWGIVADDPPPGRLPSPFGTATSPASAVTPASADSAMNSVATTNAKTILVINNELDSDGSAGGIAIEADGGLGSMDLDFTATNNYIRNWEYGVVLYQCIGFSFCTTSDFVNATVQLNSITGNDKGLVSDTDDFTSNSELNWWGAATGPNSAGADTASGNTDFTPWLCNGIDTDPAVGFQPDVTINCDGLGDLTVTKVVDWSGAPPVAGQTFEICITGPSYPSGNCQTTSGGNVTWSNVQIGDYTVTETNPGPAWSVTLPGTVSVSDTQPVTVTVTNTLRPGSLSVNKTINWQGVTPIPTTFNICISGPSYPTPFCQTTSGGSLTFGPLVPGTYTVSESPGSDWIVTITGSPANVAPNQTAQVTVQNTYVGPALACPLLDNFNRANTTKGLGANWTGATSTYRILSNQVQPFTTAGAIFWNKAPRTFGADQVACVKLTTIDPQGKHHSLILKAQATNNYAKGMILVSYDAVNQQVVVESIQPGQDWTTHLTIPVALTNGDVLGARALADGSVRVYRNGVLIGATSTTSFFANRGGRIGVWYLKTANATFDDFGGGNTP